MADSKPTLAATNAVKPCSECDRPSKARGLCRTHWMRWRRTGTAETIRQPGQHKGGQESAAARLEDLRWMLETGESPQMACHRLGVKSHTLARWLTRHGEHELARIFYNLDKQRVAA